jgi:hypothetical protein
LLPGEPRERKRDQKRKSCGRTANDHDEAPCRFLA